MDKPQQGISVYLKTNGIPLMMSSSRGSKGLLGGHGKFIKMQIDECDEVIGAALRACLNNSKPGYYQPHMHKEKDAHKKVIDEYLADRGEVSDKEFYKGTKLVDFMEYESCIKVFCGDNSIPGEGVTIKEPPPLQLPLNASDLELARALRKALEIARA